MNVIEIQCGSCNGTGLYKGMAERGQCATECTTCKGTGYHSFHYNEFTGRKVLHGTSRVFGNTCGYIHSHEDVKGIKFSQGGCTYQQWLDGEIPKPVKDLYCPYLWNNTGMGNEPCSRCISGLSGFCSINQCKFYGDKEQCWKELEE